MICYPICYLAQKTQKPHKNIHKQYDGMLNCRLCPSALDSEPRRHGLETSPVFLQNTSMPSKKKASRASIVQCQPMFLDFPIYDLKKTSLYGVELRHTTKLAQLTLTFPTPQFPAQLGPTKILPRA